MWTCPKCQEQSPDTFSSCWKCQTANASPATATAAPEKAPAPSSIPVAEPLEEPRPLPHWEFRWVTFESTDGWDAEHEVYRASSVDQEEVENWEEEGPELTAHCNALGQEGWEIVGQSFDPDGTLWVSFRRLRES